MIGHAGGIRGRPSVNRLQGPDTLPGDAPRSGREPRPPLGSHSQQRQNSVFPSIGNTFLGHSHAFPAPSVQRSFSAFSEKMRIREASLHLLHSRENECPILQLFSTRSPPSCAERSRTGMKQDAWELKPEHDITSGAVIPHCCSIPTTSGFPDGIPCPAEGNEENKREKGVTLIQRRRCYR